MYTMMFEAECGAGTFATINHADCGTRYGRQFGRKREIELPNKDEALRAN